MATYYNVKTKIKKDTITIFGCGKYGKESKTLTKGEAIFLYEDLKKFLEIN